MCSSSSGRGRRGAAHGVLRRLRFVRRAVPGTRSGDGKGHDRGGSGPPAARSSSTRCIPRDRPPPSSVSAEVPVYGAIAAAVGALARLAARAERTPSGVPALPERADGPSARDGYFEARDLLSRAGIPFAEALRVHTLDEARGGRGRARLPDRPQGPRIAAQVRRRRRGPRNRRLGRADSRRIPIWQHGSPRKGTPSSGWRRSPKGSS